MSYVDDRIDRAADWFARHVVGNGAGYVGWGWSSDVPPNPQDSAEVVCALARIGHPIPDESTVLTLIRRGVVRHSSEVDWEFNAPVDAAWRLRALKCLGGSRAELESCREILITAQDSETGGWPLGDSVTPISMTASVAAVRALTELGSEDERAARAARKGATFLVSAMLEGGPQVEPMYASAQIATLLAVPQITALGGDRVRRAKDLAVDRVLSLLPSNIGRLEEESIRRGQVTQTWYHATLQQSVSALTAGGDKLIFHPVFREAFIELLDFQQLSPVHSDRGGFRTSREGFITTYATAQAVHALADVRTLVGDRVNPARVFDMLCQREGGHHTDPQNVVPIGRSPIIMNSPAGAAFFALGSSAGVTIALLALLFAEELGKVGSRALVAWGVLCAFLGIYGFAATRLPRIGKRKVAAVTFAAFTAVVFPVVTFLLS